MLNIMFWRLASNACRAETSVDDEGKSNFTLIAGKVWSASFSDDATAEAENDKTERARNMIATCAWAPAMCNSKLMGQLRNGDETYFETSPVATVPRQIKRCQAHAEHKSGWPTSICFHAKRTTH